MKKSYKISIYTCFLLAFSLSNSPAYSIPVGFDATDGTWIISATDVSGLTFDGSTLNFESQVSSGSDFLLEGYFFWEGSNGSFGRENFTGTLFSDNRLQLVGFELVPPTSGILTGNYFAILNANGTQFINGSWNGANGIPSDDWSATVSAVPIPSAVWLFGLGLIALAATTRKSLKTA